MCICIYVYIYVYNDLCIRLGESREPLQLFWLDLINRCYRVEVSPLRKLIFVSTSQIYIFNIILNILTNYSYEL